MIQLDASVWRAFVGSSVDIPPVNSHVCYFPEGHLERTQSSSNLALSRPFIPCKVLSLRFLSDTSSDKPLVKMTLLPARLRPGENNNTSAVAVAAPNNDVVSFSKSLTSSDAHNGGGGFSVPRLCAETIFPQLAPGDTPAQDLAFADATGNHAWEFRHIYRGSPRRHVLSTGWTHFVKSKRLATGDTIVFMKKKSTAELFFGVRRRAYQYGSGRREVEDREVVEAVRRAGEGKVFEVVYYPEFGWPDFVVKKEKVKDAMNKRWAAGMNVRMAVDGDDFSRQPWFQGVISTTPMSNLRSPWRMLQVNWELPGVLNKKVCPWQVEHIPRIGPCFFPPSKKLKPAAHNVAYAAIHIPSPPRTTSPEEVSTILSIGSSSTQHGHTDGGSSGCSSTFRLFGNIIQMPEHRDS